MRDRDSDKKNRRTSLSAEDAALWQAVAETVTPAHPRPPKKNLLPERAAKDKHKSLTNVPTPPLSKPAAPPNLRGTEMDRRTEQRLRRGRIPIDLYLDLHGMVQETAHRRLNAVLTDAYKRDLRLVLVITGKGTRSREEGGVLRRKLRAWCALPPLCDFILNITPAQPHHGGSGAFYIYLRRRR